MSLRTRLGRDHYLFRTASSPYLSGDGFRAAIRCRVEGLRPRFDQGAAKLIFCESRHVPAFLEYRRANPGRPFVLVSGNGDRNFRENEASQLPSSLLHWYGQNLLFASDRASPLPIGVENRFYGGSGVPRLIRAALSKSKKKTAIFHAINTTTNPGEREPALRALRANPLALGSEGRIPVPRYLELMASCSFALSPPGNGFDCHRTWEAIYVRTIPIVKKSVWSDYFVELGLPLLALEDWADLAALTPSYLEEYYSANAGKFEALALGIPFWLDNFDRSAQLIGSHS